MTDHPRTPEGAITTNVERTCPEGHRYVTNLSEPGPCWCAAESKQPDWVKDLAGSHLKLDQSRGKNMIRRTDEEVRGLRDWVDHIPPDPPQLFGVDRDAALANVFQRPPLPRRSFWSRFVDAWRGMVEGWRHG